jgi:hypothetical protein
MLLCDKSQCSALADLEEVGKPIQASEYMFARA